MTDYYVISVIYNSAHADTLQDKPIR